MSLVLISIFVVLLTIVGIALSKHRSKKTAPGPYGVPILGYYPFLLKNSAKVVQQLADQYGDIVRLNILGREYYFLNSLEVIKEAFVSKSESTSGRDQGYNSIKLMVGQSLSTTDGPQWHVPRKLFVKSLAALGVGKGSMESKIMWQCDKLVSKIQATQGKDYDALEDLTLFTTNVMSDLLFSKEYEGNDPDYIRLKQVLMTFAECFPELELLYAGPIFYLISLTKSKNKRILEKFHRENNAYMSRIFDEKLKTFQDGQEVDLLDFYLQCHLREIRDGTQPPLYNKASIVDTMVDGLLAGGDMPTGVLYYALFMMVQHPEVQEKVYAEIEREIGSSPVSLVDKLRFNYTLAVLSELERMVEIFPFGLPRMALRDIQIAGYDVPKGANLVANLTRVMKNPKHFKNPHQFDPTNFLNEDGKLVKNPANIGFSVGSRSCAGFMIAQVEWFLCFVTLVQKFRWCEPTESSFQPMKERNEGLSRLDRFKVRAIPRQEHT